MGRVLTGIFNILAIKKMFPEKRGTFSIVFNTIIVGVVGGGMTESVKDLYFAGDPWPRTRGKTKKFAKEDGGGARNGVWRSERRTVKSLGSVIGKR